MTDLQELNGQPAAEGRQGIEVVHNGAVNPLLDVPSEEELFEAFERGDFDPESQIVVEEGEPVEAGEQTGGMTVVPEREVLAWMKDRAAAMRAAGKRGTWDGRRGTRDRSFAVREKPGFVGRYQGPCKVTRRMLMAEYGGAGMNAIHGVS